MHQCLPNYRFYAKNVNHESRLKKQLDYAVDNLMQTTGPNTDIQFSIEPEDKSKNSFILSMTMYTLGQQFVIKKTGHRVYPLIQKVIKTAKKLFKKNKNKLYKRKEKGIKYLPTYDALSLTKKSAV